MGILPFKCGINGCKKSKLQRHVHQSGDLLNNFSDRELIEAYRVWAQMRGESFSIPGGDASAMSNYMTSKMKMNRREAIRFRKNLKK